MASIYQQYQLTINNIPIYIYIYIYVCMYINKYIVNLYTFSINQYCIIYKSRDKYSYIMPF